MEYRRSFGNGFELPNPIDSNNHTNATILMMGYIDDIIVYMM
jgi:hypothetical protein